METPVPVGHDAWTVSRLLNWTRDYLTRHDLEDPRLCAEVLVAHALGMERIQLYARFETVPQPAAMSQLKGLVVRAARHEPIAYLVGHKEFFSLKLEVTADVLIPRPETELLVERVIDRLRSAEAPNLLDLGTGSGCIAVALLKHLPAAQVTGSDVSAAALAVARRNAERHKAAERFHPVEADRLNLPAAAVPQGGFDALVSNPPYVSPADLAALAPGVRDHEPRAALTDEADGLSFYRTIAEGAAAVVRPSGDIFVEVGAGQAAAVSALMTRGGALRHVATFRDRVEGHERVLHLARAAP